MFGTFTRQSMLFKLPRDVYKILGSDCKYFEVPARPIKIMYTTVSVEKVASPVTALHSYILRE